MHRKTSALFLVVALIAGLLALATTTALANTENNVTSLQPDDDGADIYFDNILSDKADGTDSLAHLTVVAPSQTTVVHWFACPNSVGDDAVITQAELASCNVAIGSDSTPKTPAAGTVLFAADEAYDVKWNIPAELDNDTVDIAILACVGDGTDIEGSGQNCRANLENDIFVDDGQSGGTLIGQTSAGEMFAICTADVTGGPGGGGPTADDPCETDFNQDDTQDVSSAERAQVDARFKPWEHGDPVPNNGFVVRATTDTSVTNLGAARDYDVDSDTDFDTADQSVDCSLITSTTTAKTWECPFFDAGAADDNKTQAVAIFVTGGGSVFCTPNCLLDSHWTASSDRAAAALVSTFEANHPSPPSGTSCTSPDKEETNNLGSAEDITVCLTDQFGDPFDEDVTLESSGPGGFIDCPNGALHDHNGDTVNEHCHLQQGDFGTDGQSEDITINNTTTPGDQTITVCVEDTGEIGGGTGSGNPAPSGHGCSDASVKDTLVKHWVTVPQHVHLVYSGTGDAADPCHSGDTTKENQVGDRETLLVCTFSNTGSGHVATSTTVANGGRLQWRISPVGAGELTATRFVGQPPSETGSNAQATVEIEAFRPGNDIIEVTLVNEDGNFVSSADVQKRVTGETAAQCSDNIDNDNDGQTDFPNDPGCANADDNDESNTGGGGGGTDSDSETTVTIRYDADDNGGTFKGQVQNARPKCSRGREVILKKVRRGPDRTVGRDSANRQGNWSIRKPNAQGRFYAKAPRTSFQKAGGGTHTCLGDRSVTIKVSQD